MLVGLVAVIRSHSMFTKERSNMKLLNCKIVKCFGFEDSGWVNFDTKQNIFHVLGRNSSGKTALLDALEYLKYERNVDDYERFQNFDSTTDDAYVLAEFSVTNKDFQIDRFMDNVQEASGIHEEHISNSDELRALFDKIKKEYENLIDKARKQEHIYVSKDAKGNYQFRLDVNDNTQRKKNFTETLNQTIKDNDFIYKNGEPYYRVNGKEFKLALDVNLVENQFFKDFPDIAYFSKEYSLEEGLPNRLSLDDINSEGTNQLTEAFIEFLDRNDLKQFMATEDPERMKELLQQFQDKTDELTAKINKESGWGIIKVILSGHDYLQITVQTDGQRSYYKSISDNTKFIFAYFLYMKAHDPKNTILIFDEPDRGFHATAQKDILKFLQDLSAKTTVILATHSEHMIDTDNLTGIKIMSRDSNNKLVVNNNFLNTKAGKVDSLALQPISDAIGASSINDLVRKEKIIITEGISEYYYLKAFHKILGYRYKLNIAPAKGDETIANIIPLFIAKELRLKIVADSSDKYTIENDLYNRFLIPGEYIKKVPPQPNSSGNSGIEDLFSKNDFEKHILQNDVRTDKERKALNEYANSLFMKNHREREKRVRAYDFFQRSNLLTEDDFDNETIDNFKALLDFCKENKWLQL